MFSNRKTIFSLYRAINLSLNLQFPCFGDQMVRKDQFLAQESVILTIQCKGLGHRRSKKFWGKDYYANRLSNSFLVRIFCWENSSFIPTFPENISTKHNSTKLNPEKGKYWVLRKYGVNFQGLLWIKVLFCNYLHSIFLRFNYDLFSKLYVFNRLRFLFLCFKRLTYFVNSSVYFYEAFFAR